VTKAAAEVGQACGDDIQQLCGDLKLGGGRVLKCLAANVAKVSQECQKVVVQLQEKSAEFKMACGSDVAKLCQFVPQGKGQVLACLKSNAKELAQACRTMLQPLWAAEPGPAASPAAAPAAAPVAAPAAPAAAPQAPAPTGPAAPAAAAPPPAPPKN
jgi:hypothetical protein